MSVQDSSLSSQNSAGYNLAKHDAVHQHQHQHQQQSRYRWRWFVADDLHLRLRCASGDGNFDAGKAVGDTETEVNEQIALFNDAIGLAEHEPLLTCIDHWCAAALDWQPVAAGAQVPLSSDSDVEALTGADADVTLTALNGPERTVELALTVERLASMPSYPSELADMAALTWRQISVALCIDRFELSDDDIQRLGPGALIVLPASFNEVWIGDIRKVAQNDEPTGVRIDATTGGLLRLFDETQVDDTQSASSTVEISASQLRTLTVMLADLIDVDVRRWRTASATQPGLTACGPLCGKRVSLELTAGASVVDNFTGEIVSLGTGHAVRLSTTTDCA